MLSSKNIFRIGLILGSLLIIFFIQRGCEHSAPIVKQKVLVSEKKGDFKELTEVIDHKTKKDSIMWKDKIIKTENPFNKKLAEEFLKAQKDNDSLKALNLYLISIQEKEKTHVFDNKDVKLEVYTKTRGEILNISCKYTLKEREVEVAVQQKETKFALYLGAGLESTVELEKLTPKAIIGIQNGNGSIISAQIGTDRSFQIGYSIRMINIKR